ncbi:MAG: HpcH/HpaI aldolase/citrate lyase family protein [Candidatus Thermoplasmatota archaeon]|nr:HpcH/HpaI aldolase/citrate lyase family protein [Candidatus Thermoplasmatota archaeon]
MKLRRSRLYVPGNTPKMIPPAGLYGADVISLDLEDAVGPDFKVDARMLVSEALKIVDFGPGVEVTVRINPLSTEWGRWDIRQIVCNKLDGIYIPKVESPEDVILVDELVTDLEEKKGLPIGRIKLFATMETAKGILNSYEIARCSKRLEGITIGGEDLTADLGGERSSDGIAIHTARQLIVLAARAAGIQAIDTVYADFRDMEGLRKETELVRKMGYDGKACIHPNQIEVIHEVFNPTPDEIVHAVKVTNAIEEARKRGSGVIALGKKMVDRPIALRAEKVLARAHAAELPIPTIEEIKAIEETTSSGTGKGGGDD